MAIDLTNVTRVKAWKPIGTSNYDTLFGYLIDYVSRRFEEYLARFTEVTSRTEYFDIPDGTRLLFLKGSPISSVTNVWNDNTWSFDSEISSDRYTILGDDGMIGFDHELTAGIRALKITYTGGMAADTDAFIAAFPDIAVAADMQVNYIFERRDELGASSQSIEGSSVSIAPVELLPEVMQILDPHQRVALV